MINISQNQVPAALVSALLLAVLIVAMNGLGEATGSALYLSGVVL